MNKKTLIIIGIIFVLGVGGFIYFQQKLSPSVSPEIKKAQQEMITNCKYDPDFCKYAAKGMIALSNGYTMTSESTYNGKVSKMIMKSDGKENSESITYSDGKEEGSFISLNKTTYMKGPGETVWTEFPPTKDEAGKQTGNLFNFEGLKQELGNATKNELDSLVVKKIGTEPCGKLTCTIFEMTEKTTNSTTKIWVDREEFFARKMEMKTKEGVSTITFEYGPVTITKPSPIKKMPAFDSTPQGTGTNVNQEEINNLLKNIPTASPQESAPVEETPTE